MENIYQFLEKSILEIIRDHSIKTICDIGCGNGRLLKLIRTMSKTHRHYIGVDYFKINQPYDQASIEFILKDSREYQDLIKKNKFDLVVCTNTLHHFQYPVKELLTIESILNKNGVFYLFDNCFNIQSDYSLVKSYYSYIDEVYSTYNGRFHRHFYTLTEATDLLQATNLRIRTAYNIALERDDFEFRRIKDLTQVKLLNRLQQMDNSRDIFKKLLIQLLQIEKSLLSEIDLSNEKYFAIIAKKCN